MSDTPQTAAELDTADALESVESTEGSTETAVAPAPEESAEAADATSEEADADGANGAEGDDAVAEGTQERPSNRVRLLEREGEVAADFLETLLDIADLDGDLDVDVDGDRAAVAIVDSDEGRVPRRLIGQDGEVLEALQELTRLAVQSATGERSRLMLDVGGHRAEVREQLVARARDAVSIATKTGERQHLEPMTAFERKVVHDAVLEAGLSSESEGTEPNRFVVVVP